MDAPINALVFLLDRSGSMQKIADSTIESFNAYMTDMRKVSDLLATLIIFDSTSIDTLYKREPIAEVPALTHETFIPRHGTPLIDAACKTIQGAIEAYKPTDKVIIAILTDGLENESREHTRADLAALVKQVTAFGWQVVFLGASIDAYQDAGRAGIAAGRTMSYNSRDKAATRVMFAGVAGQSINFYEDGAAMDFSSELKAEAGDQFVPKAEDEKAKVVEAPVAAASGGATAAKGLVDTPDV